jgi:spore coat protein JB
LNSHDRDALLRQVTVLGFMALDLHLYLNTHPTDKEALQAYNEIIAKEGKIRCQYEDKYGPLQYGSPSPMDKWPWIECPWPWQEAFNYKNSPCADNWKEPYGEELL